MVKVEPGISWELAQYRANHLSDVHYQLFFDIPVSKEAAIPAKLYLTVTLEGHEEDLQLDFRSRPEHVQAVRVGGEPVTYRYEQEHIIIPREALAEGENMIDIDFTAGDMSLNRNDDFLYTLLVPDRASTVFPCFDQPNLKAFFQLDLAIPVDWQAMTNGELLEETIEGERKVLSFKETAPISTYLFAFTAGKFLQKTRKQKGREMTMFYRESDVEKVERNAPEIFDLHLAALEYMERYTAIPLPFEKFDFALIPGFQYGGMEHVGSIFYRESSLMLDENASQSRKLGRASLIAHETAHMWFGDLVTMEWFDDVWLKEVFANFMAAKIVNPSFPDIDHELNFLLRHQPAAYGEDRSEGSHPIQQPLENLRDAGALYGRIIYQKAPVVMRQLESMMEAVAFRDGLRAYLRHFAYGNATWDDLIAILDDRSEIDLKSWSEVWVKQAGMPVFESSATTVDSGVQLAIAQQGSDAAVWAQQTQVAAFYPDSIAVRPLNLGSDAQASLIQFPGTPSAVLANASAMGYGYFPLDGSSQVYLLENLPTVDNPLLRGSGWIALYEDLLRHRLSPQLYFAALLRAIPQEKESLNLNNLLGQLKVVYWRFLDEESRISYSPEVENMLREGWRSTTDRGQQTELFRAYYQLAESPAAIAELQGIWEGQQQVPGLPLSEAERIDLAAELAVRLPQAASTILDQQLQAILKTLIAVADSNSFARPCLRIPLTRDRFFESLQQVENRATEPWVVDAVAYLHHPLHRETSLNYLLPSLELMEEIKATGDIFFPRQFITATFSGHSSPEAAAIVRQFLDERADYPYRLRNKILMAADLLFRAARHGSDQKG